MYESGKLCKSGRGTGEMLDDGCDEANVSAGDGGNVVVIEALLNWAVGAG